jgi:phosphotransferase system HPr-like phosphotransfer protein
MSRISALGVGEGTHVRVEATGPEARQASEELARLVEEGFGEL